MTSFPSCSLFFLCMLLMWMGSTTWHLPTSLLTGWQPWWLTSFLLQFIRNKFHGMDPNVLCSSPFGFISIPKKTKTSSLGWIFVRLLENMAICKPTLRLRHRHTLSKTCNEQHVSSTGVLKLEHLPQRFKSSKVWNVSQDFNQFNVHETISATDKFLLSCWNS